MAGPYSDSHRRLIGLHRRPGLAVRRQARLRPARHHRAADRRTVAATAEDFAAGWPGLAALASAMGEPPTQPSRGVAASGRMASRARQSASGALDPCLTSRSTAAATASSRSRPMSSSTRRLDWSTGQRRVRVEPAGQAGPVRRPFRVTNVPPELAIIRVGRTRHHYEIVPTRPMSMAEYQSFLDRIVLVPVPPPTP
jgi:hypothetical protein